ncbi:MAG: Rpp14/Pop5 family protein [Ignisphaera sp.]
MNIEVSSTTAAYLALILSLMSIVLIVIMSTRFYGYIKALLDELGLHIALHKKYRRVKRYILVKFICLDNGFEILSEHIKHSLNKLLGPILRYRCNVDVVSYRPEKKRAIIRVRGEAICVTYTLLALTINHLERSSDSCIAIPIKTSGLISRLKRRYLRS